MGRAGIILHEGTCSEEKMTRGGTVVERGQDTGEGGTLGPAQVRRPQAAGLASRGLGGPGCGTARARSRGQGLWPLEGGCGDLCPRPVSAGVRGRTPEVLAEGSPPGPMAPDAGPSAVPELFVGKRRPQTQQDGRKTRLTLASAATLST